MSWHALRPSRRPTKAVRKYVTEIRPTYAPLRTQFAAPGSLCHDILLPPRIKTTYRINRSRLRTCLHVDVGIHMRWSAVLFCCFHFCSSGLCLCCAAISHDQGLADRMKIQEREFSNWLILWKPVFYDLDMRVMNTFRQEASRCMMRSARRACDPWLLWESAACKQRNTRSCLYGGFYFACVIRSDCFCLAKRYDFGCNLWDREGGTNIYTQNCIV